MEIKLTYSYISGTLDYSTEWSVDIWETENSFHLAALFDRLY